MDGGAQLASPTPQRRRGPLLGVRHLQVLLLSGAVTLAFTMRTDMSVAVVVMANHTAANPDIKDYGWSSAETSTVLSSFFWGYVVMLTPAGWLADRFGAKNFMAGSLFLSGAVTALTELAADCGGLVLVCASRVVLGFCQGFVYPCTHSLLAKWIPPEENSRLGTVAYAGGQLGTVIAMPLSGVLAQSAVGWPSIFYVFGGLSACWGILFFFLGSDTPSKHRLISREELAFIEDSLKDVTHEEGKRPSTPWVAMFTSLPFIALAITHCTQNWGYYTLLTEMPTYFNDVLGFDITANGLFSALPYIVSWLLSFVFGWALHFIQKRQILSNGASRKLINSIGQWCPAAALTALSFIHVENPTAAVALLTVTVGVNSATIMGFQLNHIDLSPNFSGVMMGLTAGMATIMSILAPLFVGVVVKNNTLGEWRIVFLTAAGAFFVGNLIFLLFAKVEVQPWNDPDYSRRKEAGNGVITEKPAV